MTQPGEAWEYIRERLGELQRSFDSFAAQIRDTVGDHAVRVAKLEMRADQQDRAIREARAEAEQAVAAARAEAASAIAAVRADADRAIAGRRWSVGTWIAAVSALIALAGVVIAVIALGK
ncbi:hypothetical protein [Amycolatopsis methanolica]|uniref:Uncharacterized protein n=1 Tax=Amycolatopsis methanolica 239 TaxID=1068978 RepID=A0A076MYS0_AMYME|nr:hypothetical protein [Amycolatopsis methanolica]AIJ26354.1 hypothetical protein AMETH_6262 [Amycolatopsis methanolica 239]AIJ26413.1 hypothetical protein AMETH_6321 [Amycolatopsis methanolica 239]